MEPEEDEVSIRHLIDKLEEWYKYLFSRWGIILTIALAGGATGLVFTAFQTPVYTAECTFVLEEQSAGPGLGQYAGLAALAGIEMGNTRGGVFDGDNIIELYKSRSMIRKTLLSTSNFNGADELLLDRYIDQNQLRDRWHNNPRLARLSFSIPENQFSLKHDSIIALISHDIRRESLTVSKPDKRLSIISVKFSSRDELFAKAFTEALVNNVNDFYILTKTKRSADNIKVLQKQTDSVRIVLNAAIGGVATASDIYPNVNPALQVLRVPSQKRQVDVQATSVIYSELVKNLELAKMSLRKEAPLIQIIDAPLLPLEKSKIGMFAGFAYGFAAFFFIVIMFFSMQQLYKALY